VKRFSSNLNSFLASASAAILKKINFPCRSRCLKASGIAGAIGLFCFMHHLTGVFVMKMYFFSAPCGSGKTRQPIELACRLANKGKNVLFLQPTKELIDKTIEQELQGRPDSPPNKKFYGASKGRSVARELMEYFHYPMECGHLVFATHQANRAVHRMCPIT
jgi:hypothetical protein